MSIEAMNWAFKVKVNSSQKLVLTALAHCHNKSTGQCNPRVATLADMTDLSTRAVQKNIRKMERLGIIRTSRRHKMRGRGQGANQYVLAMDRTDFGGEHGVTLKPDFECREGHPKSVARDTPNKKGNTEKEGRSCSDVIDHSDVVPFPQKPEHPEDSNQQAKPSVGFAKKAGSLDR